MDEVLRENRRRWTKLYEDWKVAELEARLARYAIRETEQAAYAGSKAWPTDDDKSRVASLEEIADRRRDDADEFVRRLLS